VSGEVASSRERPGSGATATFVIGRSASTFGFGLGLADSRRSTRLSRRTEAGGGWDTTRVKTGAAGGATAGGAVVAGAGGGAGGGVTLLADVWSGWRLALGGGSGLGAEVVVGAGSGARSCANAGPAATAHAQHAAMSTDACRSNDRPEPFMSLSP
jgi:hypothetical protein